MSFFRRFTALLTCVLMIGAPAVTCAQNEVFPPPENVVMEGIPQIPAALAAQLARYTESRAATLTSWHPARREILISTRFAETAQIHQVKFPGGARTQLTFFLDPVREALYQPTHGDYFIFSKDVGGNDATQLYRYDLATGNITLLTDGKSPTTNPVWTHAGDRIVYASLRDGKNIDLFVVNPLDPKSDRLLVHPPNGGYSWPLDVSPNDRQVLMHQFFSAAESHLWIVDMNSGQTTLLTPKQSKETALYNNAQ